VEIAHGTSPTLDSSFPEWIDFHGTADHLDSNDLSDAGMIWAGGKARAPSADDDGDGMSNQEESEGQFVIISSGALSFTGNAGTSPALIAKNSTPSPMSSPAHSKGTTKNVFQRTHGRITANSVERGIEFGGYFDAPGELNGLDIDTVLDAAGFDTNSFGGSAFPMATYGHRPAEYPELLRRRRDQPSPRFPRLIPQPYVSWHLRHHHHRPDFLAVPHVSHSDSSPTIERIPSARTKLFSISRNNSRTTSPRRFTPRRLRIT